MGKTEFIEELGKIGAQEGKWLPLLGFSEIRMKDGSAHYPDLMRIRFKPDRKRKSLLVLYGRCERYGARLRGVGFSYDMRNVRVSMMPQEFSAQGYSTPKDGDVFRITVRGGGSTDFPIISASVGMNMSVLVLSQPITVPPSELAFSKFSYYSPEKEMPMHTRGEDRDGEFLNFIPNPFGKGLIRKDFHERIKCGDIDFISVP